MSSTQSTELKSKGATLLVVADMERSLSSDGLGQSLLEALKSPHPGWASVSWRLWHPPIH